MSFLDGLSNQFSAFGKKTKDFADSTRLSSMASDEQRTISDIHREIGKLYASLHKTDHEACFDALFARLAQAEENLQRYTQQIQDLRGVRRCARCGAEIPKGSQFCSACGAPVPPAAPPDCDFCAHCGAAVKKGMRFCTSCRSPRRQSRPRPFTPPRRRSLPMPSRSCRSRSMQNRLHPNPSMQRPKCRKPPAQSPHSRSLSAQNRPHPNPSMQHLKCRSLRPQPRAAVRTAARSWSRTPHSARNAGTPYSPGAVPVIQKEKGENKHGKILWKLRRSA